MQLGQDAIEFGAELGDQVAAGEGGEFHGGALVGVGDVVEAVWLPGHADEAGGNCSGDPGGWTAIGTETLKLGPDAAPPSAVPPPVPLPPVPPPPASAV